MRRLIFLLLLASSASAQSFGPPGDMLGKDIAGFVESSMTGAIQWAIQNTFAVIDVVPNPADWPIMSSIHDGFGWLGGFFTVALTFQGIRYIMSADSPGGRAQAKASVERLFVGMAMVGFSGMIWQLGVDISQGLKDAFVAGMVGSIDPSNVGFIAGCAVMFGAMWCFLLPFFLLFLIAFFAMVIIRAYILLLTFTFMPLIIAFHFSGLPFLRKLGEKGINLYIACLLAYPVMSFIFFISVDMLAATPANYQPTVNPLEPFMVISLAMAGFIIGAVSPFFLLGLVEKFGQITQIAGAAIGTIGSAVIGPEAALAGAAVSGIGAVATGAGRDLNPQHSLSAGTREGILRAANGLAASSGEYSQAKENAETDLRQGIPEDIHSQLISRAAAAKVPGTGGRSIQSVVEERVAEVAASSNHDITTKAGFKQFMEECGQDESFANALKTYNQQSGNYVDGKTVDWTKAEGNWDTEGRKFIMQTAAGGGLVEIQGDGNLQVTDKGRRMLQHHGTDAQDLQRQSPLPYGRPWSRESYDNALENGAAYGDNIILKSPTTETITSNGSTYDIHTAENGGQYQVSVEGNQQTTYATIDPQLHGLQTPQETAEKIRQTSEASGLEPGHVAHLMSDWRPAGQTHNGYTWHQDKGDYYENLVIDQQNIGEKFYWRSIKGGEPKNEKPDTSN